MNRKQFTHKGFLNFIKETKGTNELYQVQTDVNKAYFLHDGKLTDGWNFNPKGAPKLKASLINKDTLYYVSEVSEQRKKFLGFN